MGKFRITVVTIITHLAITSLVRSTLAVDLARLYFYLYRLGAEYVRHVTEQRPFRDW